MDKTFAANLPLILLLASALLCIAALILFVQSLKNGRKKKRSVRPAPPAANCSAAPVPWDGTNLHIGKLHEQGAREAQQDSFAVSDRTLMDTHGFLAVVADGMGGLSGGEKISAAAVESILDNFMFSNETVRADQLLLTLLQQASLNVNHLLGTENYRKSGSTLVMSFLRNGYLSFLSVGDSRIYLYRQKILMQLNREHTYQNELFLRMVNGELSFQEAYMDAQGSALTDFLGMGIIENLDMPAAPVRLYEGDKIVLMSDGVYNALSETELLGALTLPPGDAVCALRRAIQEKRYENQDNYTAVILECANREFPSTQNTEVLPAQDDDSPSAQDKKASDAQDKKASDAQDDEFPSTLGGETQPANDTALPDKQADK